MQFSFRIKLCCIIFFDTCMHCKVRYINKGDFITYSIALIGCRSIQLSAEAFSLLVRLKHALLSQPSGEVSNSFSD